MSTFALAAYMIRVRTKKSKDDYKALGCFDGTHDLATLVYDLLNRLRSFSRIDGVKSTMQVTFLIRENRTVSGIIETGAYGYESKLKDSETGETVHHRTKREADMIPFYFRFFIPDDQDVGIVLLQRFKAFGVRKLIDSELNQLFTNSFPDNVLELNPLVPEEIVKEWTRKGRVRRIRLLRHGLPRAIEDRMSTGKESKAKQGETELTITVGRGKNFPSGLVEQFSEVLRGKGAAGIYSVPDVVDDFEFNRVKLEFDSKATVHTVDLQDFKKIRARFPIDGDITQGDGGHPTFESLQKVAADLLASLGIRVYQPAVDLEV